VPGGEGWPGSALHSGYAYPEGSIEKEIEFFLKKAAEAAKEVGDKYVNQLTQNTGLVPQSATDPANPILDMYAQEDLSNVPEVLMWRQYARGVETHNINAAACRGNYRIGLTRGLVQNFLMQDGTPVYTHGTYADGDGYYMGDKEIGDVRVNRDPRLSVFLKEPGQKNILFEVDNNEGTEVFMEEPYPGTIFILVSNDASAILPTIKSRCRPVEVTRLDDATVAEYLTRRLAMDPQDAMASAHIAGGNINTALRTVDATSVSRMFFDYFVQLMRLAYQRDVKGLKQWSTDITSMGREQEVKFYEYCTRLIRENFIFNFNRPDITYMNRTEALFSQRFARFITERNAESIVNHMDLAARDIAGNANGKIVNFDFAIKMIILIKNS
jgi:hypothetical protein